ncbi:translation initiation factor IF-3 [Thermoflexibacter ruber]|uniref:Translation initiation factor IF-3 n=1 Tax=Thermoflexibacter ruber TaxID=1003 RepID=A0A1I2CJI1_9BACT|nr:translation initiation factor IF-3 [Thermoflexibacter ruber]SFE68414.1 bacterial translation initiation factor 3 (bIF-3) [Thermoflexibacter ruber]
MPNPDFKGGNNKGGGDKPPFNKDFNKNKFRNPNQEDDSHRINEQIRGVQEVRLVGENIETGIYPFKKALELAKEQGLDLVEISAKANPPVCKIIDYSKFKYEQKKKQKELKAKTHQTVVKEIRFGPNIDEHDFEFKLKHAENFLKEGNKVKAYVQFVGRTIVFKERGELILLKFAQELEEVGKVDQLPKLEGKRMILMLSPKSAAPKK